MQSEGNGFIHILASPCKTIANRTDLNSQFLSCTDLSEMRVFIFEELQHTDPHIASPGAKEHAQRGCRFAFAITGVDNN